ncbi:hypothetical protein [Marinifilum flexuosum]|uniref:Uncharacterized protein n=1 Tax=Marinifilum flexuosum TaxID=1117708 RepID=A0A419X392_9BACT|nr:hypothetical protein [Marinifilum flexuosum]RKE02214.1 hypothetical protein BXY64_2298 [Marinifilum flexuosum]
MSAKYYKFRQEELPVVGNFLLNRFKRDRVLFEGFSPEYNDEYEASWLSQIQKVEHLNLASHLTADMKQITEEMYQLMSEIVDKLDFTSAYAQRANKTLSIKFSDFGIKEAKKELRKKNVEGYLLRIKLVQQNVTDNLEALKAKGYKEEIGSDIVSMTQKVKELNEQQDEKMSERKQLVANNNGEFEKLWAILSDVSRTGKLLMKKDKLKAEEYMFSHILKKVRNIAGKKKEVAIDSPTVTEPIKETEEPQMENVES